MPLKKNLKYEINDKDWDFSVDEKNIKIIDQKLNEKK